MTLPGKESPPEVSAFTGQSVPIFVGSQTARGLRRGSQDYSHYEPRTAILQEPIRGLATQPDPPTNESSTADPVCRKPRKTLRIDQTCAINNERRQARKRTTEDCSTELRAQVNNKRLKNNKIACLPPVSGDWPVNVAKYFSTFFEDAFNVFTVA